MTFIALSLSLAPGHPENVPVLLQHEEYSWLKAPCLSLGFEVAVLHVYIYRDTLTRFSLRKREGQTERQERQVREGWRWTIERSQDASLRDTTEKLVSSLFSLLLLFYSSFFFLLLPLLLLPSLSSGSFLFPHVPAKPMGYLWKLERPKKKKKTRGSAAEPRFTMRIEFHNRATRGTMRQNCVTTRVRIYYIAGPRGGGFRTGGTCVSSVVAAKGIITLRRTRCYTQRLTEEKGSGGGRKRLPTTAKGIDNGPVISGRRRLSRHALNSGKRTAGEPFRFRKRCVILSVA